MEAADVSAIQRHLCSGPPDHLKTRLRPLPCPGRTLSVIWNCKPSGTSCDADRTCRTVCRTRKGTHGKADIQARASASRPAKAQCPHTPRHGLGRQADDAGSFGKNFGKNFMRNSPDRTCGMLCSATAWDPWQRGSAGGVGVGAPLLPAGAGGCSLAHWRRSGRAVSVRLWGAHQILGSLVT